MGRVLDLVNDEMAGTLKRVAESLVRVESGGQGFGSGVVCHTQGLVITNAHVVGSGPIHITTPQGERHEARLVATSNSHDLAALSVPANGWREIELGTSSDARPGELVLAVGNPWGVEGAVTAGVIIGVGRPAEAPRSDHDYVVASLQLRPGHSGGPMVDVHGRLIGINTMMAGPDVGLAVPVDAVKAFLKKAFDRTPVAA